MIEHLACPTRMSAPSGAPVWQIRRGGAVGNGAWMEADRAGAEGRGVVGVLDHPVKVLVVRGHE